MGQLDKVPKREKPKITGDDWDQIIADGEAADELLTDPRFKFFRNYLKNAQKSIVDYFIMNKIRAVDNPLADGTGVVHTSKEEQENELSGQYKFIEKLLEDMKKYATAPVEMKKAEEAGSVELQNSKEK